MAENLSSSPCLSMIFGRRGEVFRCFEHNWTRWRGFDPSKFHTKRMFILHHASDWRCLIFCETWNLMFIGSFQQCILDPDNSYPQTFGSTHSYLDLFWRGGFTKNFRYPKREVLRLFWGWVFAYISRILQLVYRLGFLHFRHLKCLVWWFICRFQTESNSSPIGSCSKNQVCRKQILDAQDTVGVVHVL